MNSNAILTSDVLDLLFENRNKDYGAYALRKLYPARMKQSLLMMLGIAALFAGYSFLPGKKSTSVIPIFGDSITVREYREEQPKEKPKKQPETKPLRSQAKLLSDMKIVDEKDSSDILTDITHMQIGSTTVITDFIDAPVEPDPRPAATAGTTVATPAPDNKTPVDNPDVQPAFPGGEAALIAFLQKHLSAPEGLEEGATTQVKVRFVVGFDGNLESFNIIQDGGTDFNNEVVRVLKKMPKWNPGKKGGRNVPAYYALPVKFVAPE